MISKYDFSKASVETLIMLNLICSMSDYPEDKEMQHYITDELSKRLKDNPDMKIDLSHFMEDKNEHST